MSFSSWENELTIPGKGGSISFVVAQRPRRHWDLWHYY